MSQPTIDEIRLAAKNLGRITTRTPLLESARLNQQMNARVLFKAEPLQVTGSFKIRGAFNKISSLTPAQRENGIVAYSSGNHAQAVAAVAGYYNIPATIVMPEDAPEIKIRNTRAYGAEVIPYDRRRQSRETIGADISTSTGASLIKPYDDYAVIAGQGTLALEAIEDAFALGLTVDAYISPCGGGGLAAGGAIAVSQLSPKTEILIAEPVHYDDTLRSLQSGKRIRIDTEASSLCDAIVTPEPGQLTFPILQQLLSGGTAVSDEDVSQAIRLAFDHLKLVVEPGGAVALAALTSGKLKVENKTVIVVLSGGNIDPELFCKILRSEAGHSN